MAETPANNAPTPVALSPTQHKGLKIKQLGSADYLAKNHFTKVYAPEFTKAGTDYPIIFVRDPETQEFFAGGLWGLQQNENLFVEDGRWTGGFFPAAVRCYPFAMSIDPQDADRLYIGIYEDSPLISSDEGELMFNDDGSETPWMVEVKDFLVKVYNQEELTRKFVKELDEMGLLIPQSLNVKTKEDAPENAAVSGFFVVDKEKLQALPDEKIIEMKNNGALEIIYAHLMSLGCLDKLLKKKNDRMIANGEVPAAQQQQQQETPVS